MNSIYDGNGSNDSNLGFDVKHLCNDFENLVKKIRKKSPRFSDIRDQSTQYRETRSYAEGVVKMFSNDKILSTINGDNDLSPIYNLADRVKLAVVGVFDKEKASKMQKNVDKKIYTGMLEKFCDKYTGVLEDMDSRCANAEKIYESMMQACDTADVASRQDKSKCKQFRQFEENARDLAAEKRLMRDSTLENDPFSSKINELTNDILASESKSRSAGSYSRIFISKAESNELLSRGYERDARVASRLVDSCNYISDTLFRNITQFKTLIKMHNTIGDADEFDNFAKSVHDLARKTGELGKMYYERLPKQDELKKQVRPYEKIGEDTNAALIENDIFAANDIEKRLKTLDDIHTAPKTL